MTGRVACRTPNPDRPGVTNVPAWKFEACRTALLAALEDGAMMRAPDLVRAAGARLTDAQRADLGSLGWHMTTVRLELEARGEIARLPGGPVRLHRPDPAEGGTR